MIKIAGIREGRIVRPADEAGNVHVEYRPEGGAAIIESVHATRLSWDTPEEEAAIFGATPRAAGEHAPGPWWLRRGLFGSYRIYSRFRHIGTVRANGAPREQRLTAGLIAAAPELYATLSELEFLLQRHAELYEANKPLMTRVRNVVFRVKRGDQ